MLQASIVCSLTQYVFMVILDNKLASHIIIIVHNVYRDKARLIKGRPTESEA